jgi:glycerophosphoryl diester phosphodiesterase
MNTKRINRGGTRMVAHRGLSGLERENTNLAFVAAANRSYFGIETDVHCLADGNVILIHDDHTTRVSGVELTVEEQSFETLRAIRLLDLDGTNTREDLRMPALEEYISICKKYEKTCVLELKNPMSREQVKMIMDRIAALGYLDEVIFISFAFENLVYVKEFYPAQRVQFLFKAFTEELIGEMGRYGIDIDVYYKALTEELVRDLHAKGFEINCWTVDDPEVAERLVSWGVDYITSNILE